VVAYALTITFSVLGAYLLGTQRWGLSEAEGNNLTFYALSLAQVLHVFNLHSERSFFNNEITRNRYIWYATALCLFILALTYYVPFPAASTQPAIDASRPKGPDRGGGGGAGPDRAGVRLVMGCPGREKAGVRRQGYGSDHFMHKLTSDVVFVTERGCVAFSSRGASVLYYAFSICAEPRSAYCSSTHSVAPTGARSKETSRLGP
jgi:hypothetical protein